MGLDTSHDAWHGAYSAFMRWREAIAKAAGLPPLRLMEGFYSNEGILDNPFYKQYCDDKANGFTHDASIWNQLPIKWDYFKDDALSILLHHSDCDGEIEWTECKRIAERLKEVMPNLPQGEGGGHIGNWRDKTQTFIDGLVLAYKSKENLDFH